MSATLKELEETPFEEMNEYMKSTPTEDPQKPITKVPRSLPVAFAMLEKVELSNNPGCLSAHTVFGDGEPFYV